MAKATKQNRADKAIAKAQKATGPVTIGVQVPATVWDAMRGGAPFGVTETGRIKRGRGVSVNADATETGLAALVVRVSKSSAPAAERKRALLKLREAGLALKVKLPSDEDLAANLAKGDQGANDNDGEGSVSEEQGGVATEEPPQVLAQDGLPGDTSGSDTREQDVGGQDVGQLAAQPGQLADAPAAAEYACRVAAELLAQEMSMPDDEYTRLTQMDIVGTSRVDMAAHDAQEPVGHQKHFPTLAGGQRRAWVEQLATAVAVVFFCQVKGVPGSGDLELTGRATHRALAEKVIVNLMRCAIRSGERAHGDLKNKLHRDKASLEGLQGFMATYRTGFVGFVAGALERDFGRAQAIARTEPSDLARLVQLQDGPAAFLQEQKEARKAAKAGKPAEAQPVQ